MNVELKKKKASTVMQDKRKLYECHKIFFSFKHFAVIHRYTFFLYTIARNVAKYLIILAWCVIFFFMLPLPLPSYLDLSSKISLPPLLLRKSIVIYFAYRHIYLIENHSSLWPTQYRWIENFCKHNLHLHFDVSKSFWEKKEKMNFHWVNSLLGNFR